MSKVSFYEEKAEEFAEPLAAEMGFELVDVEFVKEGREDYLRIYIDKPGDINITDCETFSRAMNEILDREEFIDIPYIFEVSSPGLTRPLKKEKDYDRSVGKLVDISLYKAIDKMKYLTGILKSYTAKELTIEDESSSDELTIERSNIAGIRLAYVEKK